MVRTCGVLHVLLANVLRATAACHFWTLKLPKLVGIYGVLRILTCARAARHFSTSELQKLLRSWGAWKCGLRHSGVPFFISLLNSYPRVRCFTKATFRTSGTTNHWKNATIRDFPNISRVCLFFLVTLLTLWRLDFSSLLFNFPYCRKLDF